MHDLAEVARSQAEWRTWRAVCVVLERDHGIDINKANRLHAALVAWGEHLVRLRGEQPEELRDRVLAEALARAEVEIADVLEAVQAA